MFLHFLSAWSSLLSQFPHTLHQTLKLLFCPTDWSLQALQPQQPGWAARCWAICEPAWCTLLLPGSCFITGEESYGQTGKNSAQLAPTCPPLGSAPPCNYPQKAKRQAGPGQRNDNRFNRTQTQVVFYNFFWQHDLSTSIPILVTEHNCKFHLWNCEVKQLIQSMNAAGTERCDWLQPWAMPANDSMI